MPTDLKTSIVELLNDLDALFKVKKGDNLGNFEMGSTIVLFIQNTAFKDLKEKSVKFGESIGEFHAN